MIRSKSTENASNSYDRQELVTKLEHERSIFISKSREIDLSTMSTLDFWHDNQSEMPLLADLARIEE